MTALEIAQIVFAVLAIGAVLFYIYKRMTGGKAGGSSAGVSDKRPKRK